MSSFTLKYGSASSVVPRWVIDAARSIGSLAYRGTGRDCVVCGKSSKRFMAYGAPSRDDARCPRCGSLERHRLVWWFWEKKTDLFDGRQKSMLHVAPERCLEDRLRKTIGQGYLTADYMNPRAMVRMDITDIRYPDNSFDVVYCSHVLEHVPDDVKAMSEIRRVLKKDGWAVLLVPVTAETTYEDPTITDPRERLEKFGQEDHVRRYGPDFADRLRSVGYVVEVFGVSSLATPEEVQRMGLGPESGDIFYCRKG